VLQALPLFVAADKGYFKERGLSVEITTFNSAMEKDVAISAGQLAGYFGDLQTPAVLVANKVPVRMVATIYNTTGKQRMFAILASPKRSASSLQEVADAGLAGSSNTILEYLAVKILRARNVPAEKLKLVEIKSIPIRLQMLLSDQVPGALLPEPLVTLAEQKGAKVLADDAGLGLSATVLAFSDAFLKAYPAQTREFLAAVEQASLYINKNPDAVRPIMNRQCKVPETLQQSFPIPLFPKLTVPEQSQVMDVYRWLREKKIIKTDLRYTQMVADGFLP
jgi:NitT/TauT family transport system substrate-binding protein